MKGSLKLKTVLTTLIAALLLMAAAAAISSKAAPVPTCSTAAPGTAGG